MKSGHRNTLPISVLVADDQEIFALALRLLLERKYSVVGIVDGRSAVKKRMKLEPDVIVADVSMPLLNELDGARRIEEAAPKVKIVFLTMRNDPHLATGALEFRNVALVLKRSDGLKLLGKIEDVLQGRRYLSPNLSPANRVFGELSKKLTNRQRDIVRLFAEGRRGKEVASILNLSLKTVEFHKYRTMREFDIKNTAELVLFALERGLIFRRFQVQ